MQDFKVLTTVIVLLSDMPRDLEKIFPYFGAILPHLQDPR